MRLASAGPPADAFLAEACRDDQPLRCEVELLLAQQSGNGPLDNPAWD